MKFAYSCYFSFSFVITLIKKVFNVITFDKWHTLVLKLSSCPNSYSSIFPLTYTCYYAFVNYFSFIYFIHIYLNTFSPSLKNVVSLSRFIFVPLKIIPMISKNEPQTQIFKFNSTIPTPFH